MATIAKRILITGSGGQIGTELSTFLGKSFGAESVVTSDIALKENNTFESHICDVTNYDDFSKLVERTKPTALVHLASILSATGEKNPDLALKTNMRGTEHALDLARKYNMRVLIPSSIAAFGPSTPLDSTPDDTIMRPSTMYGVSKVYAELLGEYYHHKFGVDFRSIRYPGIISTEAPPGGGTTDYTIEMYEQAKNNPEQTYDCFLTPETSLPMMYMPDVLTVTKGLLEAENLSQCTYNVTGFSLTPKDLEKSIQSVIPGFQVNYPEEPDFRQPIADSWPNSIDDANIRQDLDWEPQFDLDAMTKDIIN
jgi:threonine 3-dehydrogenase